MIRWNSCDSSDAYLRVKGTITVPNTATQEAVPNNININVIFENCSPFYLVHNWNK